MPDLNKIARTGQIDASTRLDESWSVNSESKTLEIALA